MEVAERTIEKRLAAYGYPAKYTNILAVKDTLESFDRDDYHTVTDAVDDAIEDCHRLDRKD